MKSKKNNREAKDYFYIFLACILGLLLIFILFPFLPKLVSSFSESDMTGRWISVFMAFVFSTIVTKLLLNKQTVEQLETKKQEKIYEEKLKMYRSYLDELGEIIKNGELKKDSETKLRIMTASIAIHADNKTLKDLCKDVVNVVRSQCDPFDSEDDWERFKENQDGLVFEKTNERKKIRSDIMLTSLMKIASCFHRELYKDGEKLHEQINYQEERDLFSRLYNIANPDEEDGNIQNGPRNTISSVVNENRFPNWKLTLHEKGEWKMLSLEPKGGKKYGEIYIRPWGDRCAMVMRYLNENNEGEKDFADEVKNWGYYRSNLRTVYGEWRNTLDDNQWNINYNANKQLHKEYSFPREIQANDFQARYENDEFFREQLMKTFESLINWLEDYHQKCIWKEHLSLYAKGREGLKIVPHIGFLSCEYATSSGDDSSGSLRLELCQEKHDDGSYRGIVQISRVCADSEFDRLLDLIQGDLTNGRTKAQLKQEIIEHGHVKVDSFVYAMNEDGCTIDQDLTANRVKDAFDPWHQRIMSAL